MMGIDLAVEWGGRHGTGLTSNRGLIHSSFYEIVKILVVKGSCSFQTAYGSCLCNCTWQLLVKELRNKGIWEKLWALQPLIRARFSYAFILCFSKILIKQRILTLKTVKSTHLQHNFAINKTWFYISLLNCYTYQYIEIPITVANHSFIQQVYIGHLLYSKYSFRGWLEKKKMDKVFPVMKQTL